MLYFLSLYFLLAFLYLNQKRKERKRKKYYDQINIILDKKNSFFSEED